MADTVKWSVGDGHFLEFGIYDFDGKWKELAGLYIFCHVKDGYWHPLYIGQTDNFKTRFASHERIKEALNKGATKIHVTLVPEEADRSYLERKLIEIYQPPMNDQLR